MIFLSRIVHVLTVDVSRSVGHCMTVFLAFIIHHSERVHAQSTSDFPSHSTDQHAKAAPAGQATPPFVDCHQNILRCTLRPRQQQIYLHNHAGQGLYRTPEDVPLEGQGASLIQVAPAGLANMQSPWNTPALLQPPIPQPPDRASLCKPAGNDCMPQLAELTFSQLYLFAWVEHWQQQHVQPACSTFAAWCREVACC